MISARGWMRTCSISQSSHVSSSAQGNRSEVENELSNLFAKMALPGHDRRTDEYILVRQTGQDKFAGTD
ncbi:VirE2 family protein [Rhizobium nepotum]|uniref:VirE2 family protein n=1 Tax=Rhizobium nepotum TaxID=1035271 RepID=UPI003CF55240